ARESPGGSGGLLARDAPFLLEPAVELDASRQMKSRKQLAAVQLDGAEHPPGLRDAREVRDVAPHRGWFREADFLIAAAPKHLGSQGSANGVNCLAQRRSRVCLVELGP